MRNVKVANATNIKILLTVINVQNTGSSNILDEFNKKTITIRENLKKKLKTPSNKKGMKNQIVTAFRGHVCASPNAIVSS